MKDLKSKIKHDVLQKVIDMMDERMVGDLKGKFAKVDIVSDDPKMAENIKDKVVEAAEEEKEPKKVEDDEDLDRLMEMYRELK